MIEIKADDRPVLERLQRLQAALGDLRPALLEIGEDLQHAAMRRFETSTGPDGQRWPSNTQATMEAYLRRISGEYDAKTGKRTGDKKGYFLKDGRAGSKAANVLAGKKPLIGESRALSTTIRYQVGGNTLLVGSNQPYAAMQQFGGTKAEFPRLWGDIPARPFLGVSPADRAAMMATLKDYLGRLAG